MVDNELPPINFRWELIWENRGILAKGLTVAISVSIIALVFSLVLGLLLALTRMSRFKLISGVSSVYVNIFRGIPALVSVIWV